MSEENKAILKRDTSDEFVKRDTLLLFYIWGSEVNEHHWWNRFWKTKGFAGSISELGRQLHYADDSAINRRVHRLMDAGYLKTKRTKDMGFLVLTGKGTRAIYFLILPRYSLFLLLAAIFADVWWGEGGVLYGTPIIPSYLLASGVIVAIATIALAYMIKKGEEMLWEAIKAPAEGEKPPLQP